MDQTCFIQPANQQLMLGSFPFCSNQLLPPPLHVYWTFSAETILKRICVGGGGACPRYVRGQRQLLDVVDPDQLSDAEATQMLQRLDAAEPGDGIQELDRSRRQA